MTTSLVAATINLRKYSILQASTAVDLPSKVNSGDWNTGPNTVRILITSLFPRIRGQMASYRRRCVQLDLPNFYGSISV